jgi:NADPH:quinone reductase-like Zn-dependent oxidoreductase
MKAIKIAPSGGLECLHLVDLPEPAAPGKGEITVRIHASSLNYHDLRVVSKEPAVTAGLIPMADGAGIVTAIGEGVAEFSVGDRVVACFFPLWQAGEKFPTDFTTVPGDGIDGFARESVTMAATAFTRAPEGYSHEEAATLTTAGLTAWRSLVVDAGVKAGDVVLVLGSGGVSILALQMAKSMGARVIATTSDPAKAVRLKELGAETVINYRATPDWGDAVLAATGGIGADIVIEVGGPGTLAQSIRACAAGGHIAYMGVLTSPGADIPMRELMAKHLKLQGLIVGTREQQMDMVRALEGFAWRPVIDRTFGLAEIGEAFAWQKAGNHFGKVCLSF